VTNGDLTLTIGELAAMVGVSTDTIRAWERRYGVLSPVRTSTRHRRYDMENVETLRRGLVIEGASRPEEREVPVDAPSDGDEAPWRAVGDLLPSVLCILDARGDIIDANMAFARLGRGSSDSSSPRTA
jgi:MerR HTH family regulatory protein